MSDIVIKVDNVYKQYRLGTIGGGTLQGEIQSWLARKRGMDDPNLKIGSKAVHKNEKFDALRGISFEVHKGDTLGVIGGNGAGKSTILKILSSVTAPSSGTVYVKGRISSMLEVGTGFNAELTGRENIYLNGAILGMSKKEVDSKIDDIIAFSECEKFIDTPVKRYSSGMYVKLAFSVAAHLDSDILVMDEVLAVGDMKFQQKCLGKMGDVADKDGRTVLYVSHNMNTIRQLCNRCIVLDKGKVIFDGGVEDAIAIYMNSNFSIDNVEKDLSNERMNFLDGIPKVKLQRSKLLNKENALYDNDDFIEFSVSWKQTERLDNLHLRVELCFADDTPVATSLSGPLKCGQIGEIVEQSFKLDISRLTSGRYKATLLLYSKNEVGGVSDLDAVYPGISFELVRTFADSNSVRWNPKSWGKIRLNDLEICDSK